MQAITATLLHTLAPGGNNGLILALAPVLDGRLAQAGVDTPLRVAHFLGQAVYETGYLSRLSENLHYSAGRIAQLWSALSPRANALAYNPEALANAIYANRFGNGDEASGDGWRYRGRGLFQLTFKDNYAEFASAEDPDAVATSAGAVASAIKFWNARKINEAADDDDIAHVTRLVQGGASGVTERALIKHQALRLLTA